MDQVDKIHGKRNFTYQYAATLSAALITISFGMHLGWPSPSLPILFKETSEIHVTDSEGSWIAGMVHTAVPVGVLVGVLLADRMGRKRSLLITSPMVFISWLGIAFAGSVQILLGARMLAGVAGGLAQTVIVMYISEIADKNIRGLLSSWIVIGIKLGMLVVNIIGIYFTIKVTALIACVIPILHFATFFFMPESPRFYILIGKDAKAATSLNKFTRTQNADFEISELAASIRVESKEASVRLTDLVAIKSNRRLLKLMLCLVLAQHSSGFIPITFYCLTIFTQVGGPIQGSTATMLFFSLQFIVSTLCGSLLDKMGRRPLLIISASISTCALAITAAFFFIKDQTSIDTSNLSFVPLVALLVFIVSCNIGLTFIPLTILSEVFPIEIKAMGTGITHAFFAAFCMLVTKLFQLLKDEYGIHVPLSAFTFLSIFGVIYIVCCVPETKGKTLEEVQAMLKGTSLKNDEEFAKKSLLNSNKMLHFSRVEVK